MGVGIGGEFPEEFEACGVPVKQRGSRSNEALEVITKLWTEQNVTFEGRYTKFSDVTLAPHPTQKPHPPIWVAGRKEPAMRRAATYADGWLPYMYTPEMLAESIGKIKQFGAEGWTRYDRTFATGCSSSPRSIPTASRRASRPPRPSGAITRRISRRSPGATRYGATPTIAASA